MKLFFLFLLSLSLSCSLKRPGKLVTSESGKENFCVVGDVGNGSSTQMKVAEAMKESGCEKLILLGDLIYPEGIKKSEDKDLKKLFFEPYADFKRIYIVLGNHDYQGNVEAWINLSSHDPRVIHPASYFRERIGNSCLFFLDTNFHAREGLLEKEAEWISSSTDGCKYMVAFSHHPYASSGKRHGPATNRVKEFYEKNIVGKFAYIFSGHEHILNDEGEIQGTRQIISGAGGKYDSGESPGFVIFTLDLTDPEASTYRLIRI